MKLATVALYSRALSDGERQRAYRALQRSLGPALSSAGMQGTWAEATGQWQSYQIPFEGGAF